MLVKTAPTTCTHFLALYPGSSKNAPRKTREPSKIQYMYMHDIEGGRNLYLAWRINSWDFYWEKCDGKTAESSKLESPGTDMLAWAMKATNVSKYIH